MKTTRHSKHDEKIRISIPVPHRALDRWCFWRPLGSAANIFVKSEHLLCTWNRREYPGLATDWFISTRTPFPVFSWLAEIPAHITGSFNFIWRLRHPILYVDPLLSASCRALPV